MRYCVLQRSVPSCTFLRLPIKCQKTFQLVVLKDHIDNWLHRAMAFRATALFLPHHSQPPGALTWETPTSSLALPRLSALCFLAHGGTRPLPPTRDPNRPRHFRFPSAFFSSVSAAGSEPVSYQCRARPVGGG